MSIKSVVHRPLATAILVAGRVISPTTLPLADVEFVNVGCGQVARNRNGWLNIDGAPSLLVARLSRKRCGPWDDSVKFVDVRKGLPIGDAGVSGVYSSHFLEHLTEPMARRFLAECRRVLRPGGCLSVVVPDLQRMVQYYAERTWSGDELVDAMAFVAASWEPHKWMYDQDTLSHRLTDAGFGEVRRLAAAEQSSIPGLGDVHNRRDVDLHLEATAL